ncbi:MAG: hypothetical protein Q7R35_17880 [Elusimicrobiota bacterium]|nr:hypothetical protein [Elusimicrobiota bacterium]
MSEAEYTARVLARFKHKYPAKSGWKVFTMMPSRGSASATTAALLAYLEEKRPAWLVKHSAAKAGYLNLIDSDELGADLPPAEWTSGPKFTHWYGEITLSVDGEPLAYLRLPMQDNQTWSSIAFIAYKSQSAMEKLHTEKLVTNAMLLAVNAGRELEDAHLLTSLGQLKTQFKATAAREGLSRQLKEGPTVGFSA